MAVLTATQSQRMFDTGPELAPRGTFVATCIDIRDQFGVERRKYQSDEMETVNLTAFLFGFRDKAGKPFMIASRSFRISGNEKSNLIAFLKSWLGESPRMGWDYMDLKGRKALISVDHTPSKKTPGLLFADIVSISPLPEGFLQPPPVVATGPAPVAQPVPAAVEAESEPLPF